MATGLASNRCSVCEKNEAKCNCTGCKKFFCIKHFNKHRQQLSIQFDRDVVRTHDELLEQIDQAKQTKNSFPQLFSQIDRWETATIDKVHNAAENVRHQLTQLIISERDMLKEQSEALTKEIRRRLEEDDFAEDDLKYLQKRMNQLQQSLEQLTQSDNSKMIVIETSQIDWNRLIYAQKAKGPRESIPTTICTEDFFTLFSTVVRDKTLRTVEIGSRVIG